MDSIPSEMVEKIAATPESLRDDPLRYYVAASEVIATYLGKESFRTIVLNPIIAGLNETASLDDTAKVDPARFNRILRIGEALFTVRTCAGFPEMCRRFKGRELRSTFFEITVAKFFFMDGFEILVQPETGTKRADFDFQACLGNQVINVEATALQRESFSFRTVANALAAKRKQLPDQLPACIFCLLPETWNEVEDLRFKLMFSAFNFFAETRRINLVSFVREYTLQLPGNTRAMTVDIINYFNPRPRRPTNALSFLANEPEAYSIIRWKILKGESLGTLAERNRNSSFHTWVDSILGPPAAQTASY